MKLPWFPRFGRVVRRGGPSLAALLVACGGGGGGSASAPTGDTGAAQQCSATNPYRGDATAVTTTGDLATEKRWLRSYFDAAYLWYAEVPSVDPSLPAYGDATASGHYNSMDSYFEALKTPAIVAGTARRKDAFSFTYPTRAWQDLSVAGVAVGYGIEWSIASATPPRDIRIAYIEPGSPAAAAGLQRGDALASADGLSADEATDRGVAALNAALFPSASSAVHTFVFARGATSLPAVNLTSAAITKQPVPVSRVFNVGGRVVGYLVFNDHLATAETPLTAAIESFRHAGVSELVLDLRYNGGGYLFLASQLAYMVAGPAQAAGKVFERLQYNDKRSAETAAASASLVFTDRSCELTGSLSCSSARALPSLGLSRVTVLVSGSTCSASESVVNGLRGIDVDVRLVGSTTCGKPYGFSAKDNCGISYFPIEFQGVNAKGQGDYAGGFSPHCVAGDDLDRALGDPAEGQLAAALMLIDTGACPPVSMKPSAAGKPTQASPAESRSLIRGLARESRIHVREFGAGDGR